MIRVFLALTIFIRFTFRLVPTELGMSKAFTSEGLETIGRLAWLEWGIAAAIAYGYIVYAKIGARVPESRPGFGIITFALVVELALGVAMAVMFAGVKDLGPILVVLIGVAIFLGPIAIAANALLAIGLFKLLFNLEERNAPDPWDAVVVLPDSPAASPATGAASPSPQGVAHNIAALRASLATRPADTRPHQQLHRLLLADPAQQSEMLAHAREYLAVLVKESRSDEATKVLQECVDKDPAFKPFPDQVVPLAKHAIARGQAMLALRIMNQFDRLNPGHASTPTVYFLSARALRDQKQLAQARQVLDAFLARFPGDALAVEAKMLRDGLERP
jgi:hypothetical protein